jgi:hypothetical protein
MPGTGRQEIFWHSHLAAVPQRHCTQMLLRNRGHRRPATRCGRRELARVALTRSVPKARRHQRTAQGCRPSAAFAAPHFTGLAPNVTFGSGVGTGRPGVGPEPRRQASHSRSPRGRGRWTCPVHRPRSGHGPHTGDERHRSARAQSRRSGGPGWAIRSLPAPAPSPMATPGSVNKAGPRVAPGVPGVQETARSAVSCTGLRGASSNSTVFPRISLLRRGIQL